MHFSLTQQMQSQWLNDLPKKPVRDGLINLSSNCLIHPYLKDLQQLFLKEIKSFTHYPNHDGLREHYAKLYQLAPDQVGFTAGSDHLIAMLMQIANDLNLKQLFLQHPFYYNYRIYAQCLNKKIHYLSFQSLLSLQTLETLKCAEPSLIFLIHPCPMTGEVLEERQLNDWFKQVENAGHFIVFDQAYAGFGSELYIELVKNYSNVLLFQTFSKRFGAAGLRFCFYLGFAPLIARLKAWGIENTISSIAVHYAFFVHQHLEAYQRIQNDICLWRQQAYDHLQNKYAGFKYYKSLANFVSLYLEAPMLNRVIETAKVKEKIFLKSHANNSDENCLRFTVATPDILQAIYRVFAEVFACNPIYT